MLTPDPQILTPNQKNKKEGFTTPLPLNSPQN